MWWGTAVEVPDPAALARFYSALLDWPLVHEEPGTSVLAAAPPDSPHGAVFHVFMATDDYVAPRWPAVEGEQRAGMHLDLQVDDLDAAVAEAVELGATLADHQPHPGHLRVLLDPVGRPFCVCLETED
ncbi:MAG: uncharacterized protein JWR42_2473 [Marmoricola sp.]|jgi:catechol 2,3-dioxygenase-like lactoylglutathione lyase family enzyme|nr:uncharacterized protein [Marmoricola sp.]